MISPSRLVVACATLLLAACGGLQDRSQPPVSRVEEPSTPEEVVQPICPETPALTCPELPTPVCSSPSMLVTQRQSAQQSTGQEKLSRVVQDQTYALKALLDESTVRCSSAGYSASFLKVLIPEVAQFTVFDHRNAGEAAPCIAAGECSSELNPENFLGTPRKEGREEVQIRAVLTLDLQIDHDARTCEVSLREELTTEIRGVPFFHLRQGPISSRVYEDCLGG
jgi:hypothetical protein